MRRVSKLLSLAVLLCSAHAHAAETFIALAYHDVQDNPATERIADAETVSTADLLRITSTKESRAFPVTFTNPI